MSQILAYDLGGSSLRLAIVDADGTFLGKVRKPLKMEQQGDRAEADPDTWWTAFIEASAALQAMGHDLGNVTAVAGCGFTRTQVVLDADGNPIRPAIGFQDSRAAPMLETLAADPAKPLDHLAGPLGPFDPLARLLWLQKHEPENWARAARVMEPKDYLNFRLTGVAAMDTISRTPMARVLGDRPAERLQALGIDPAILPGTLSPFDALGDVRARLPAPLDRLAGATVYCGSLDTWTGVLGSGALIPGAGYSISGTSDVFGVISDRRCTAEGLLTVEWGPDLWQLGGPSQGAASRLDWAMTRFHPDEATDTALTRALAATAPAPLFLPYLDGERVPYWDASLRGAFLGIGTGDDNDAFLRGVAEGMTYLSREILHRAETATGTRISHVSFSGGLSGHEGLCQLKADVLNRPVLVPRNVETGLQGASRLPLGPDAARTTLPPGASRIYHPTPSRQAYHDTRFQAFRSATGALQTLMHQISAPPA